MEIGVPSRFACLNIEDEDLSSMQIKPKETKKKVKKPTVPEPPPKTTNNKKSDKNPPATKKPAQKPVAAPALTTNKKGKKKQVQQWEEWKQKDEELENGHYEEDLRNAIMLSKLDLEHNKEVYANLIEEAAKQESKNKKTKKNKTVSLDKFLNGNAEKPTNNHVNLNSKGISGTITTKQCDFFNSVESDTKSEIKKEQVNAKRKKRDVNINEVISIAQYQEKYETEHRLRLAAEQELKDTKSKLTDAETKIKAFFNLISQGQKKDKAALLIENQHLTAVKNDLTDSVSSLHALLEKERSKLAALTASLSNNKQKEKKRKGN